MDPAFPHHKHYGQRNLYFIKSLNIFNQRTYYQTTYLKRYLSS